MADLKVVRLTSLKYPQPDGEGAYRAGGRWNLKGTRVVYTSAQISLAVLEYLVHLGYPHMADDRVLVRVDIPGDVDIEVIGVDELPSNWKNYPAPYSTQRFGSEWVKEGRSAVLSVPSVVVEEERNYILNPGHPDFQEIRFSEPEHYPIDTRLIE